MSIEEMKAWLTRPHARTEDAIRTAISVYEGCAAEIDQLREVQREAKLLLSEIFAETCEDYYRTDVGTAYLSSPQQRVSYDAKGLDALVMCDPTIAEAIGRYRRVTHVAGTLVIRAPQVESEEEA